MSRGEEKGTGNPYESHHCKSWVAAVWFLGGSGRSSRAPFPSQEHVRINHEAWRLQRVLPCLAALRPRSRPVKEPSCCCCLRWPLVWYKHFCEPSLPSRLTSPCSGLGWERAQPPAGEVPRVVGYPSPGQQARGVGVWGLRWGHWGEFGQRYGCWRLLGDASAGLGCLFPCGCTGKGLWTGKAGLWVRLSRRWIRALQPSTTRYGHEAGACPSLSPAWQPSFLP